MLDQCETKSPKVRRDMYESHDKRGLDVSDLQLSTRHVVAFIHGRDGAIGVDERVLKGALCGRCLV